MKSAEYRIREFFEYAPLIGPKISWRLRQLRIDRARLFPAEFAREFGEKYKWPDPDDDHICLKDLGVVVEANRYRKEILANFEGWHIRRRKADKTRVAFISHFATPKASTRQGYGSGVIRGTFRFLNARYGVTSIYFNENDKADRYPTYPQFFTDLGAYLSNHRLNDRPLWIWNLSQVDHLDVVRRERLAIDDGAEAPTERIDDVVTRRP